MRVTIKPLTRPSKVPSTSPRMSASQTGSAHVVIIMPW